MLLENTPSATTTLRGVEFVIDPKVLNDAVARFSWSYDDCLSQKADPDPKTCGNHKNGKQFAKGEPEPVGWQPKNGLQSDVIARTVHVNLNENQFRMPQAKVLRTIDQLHLKLLDPAYENTSASAGHLVLRAVAKTTLRSASKTTASITLLIVVEGPHDVEFLKRISTLLHRQHSGLPELGLAEAEGRVIFLPAGGGNLWSCTHRLASLGLHEAHLYDREIPPATEQRQQLVDAINARPNCRAALTRKRALENYLHPSAILQAGGVEIDFTDEDAVPQLVAQAAYRTLGTEVTWAELSHRARKRRCERAKCWLNTRAVECMTPQLLHERDPEGELARWLLAIAVLLVDVR